MAVNLLNLETQRITVPSHHRHRPKEKALADGISSQKVWKGMTNSLDGSKMRLCKIHGAIRVVMVVGLVEVVEVVEGVVIGEIGVSKSNDLERLSLFSVHEYVAA